MIFITYVVVCIHTQEQEVDKIYVGSTNDLKRRLAEHNAGLSKATKPFIPWEVDSFIAVRGENRARQLEKYFKTGSGKAVLRKRILTRAESGSNL